MILLHDMINGVEDSQHFRLHDVDQLASRTFERVAVKMKKHVQALANCCVKQLQSLRITFKLPRWFGESFQRRLGICHYVSFIYPGPVFCAEKLDPSLMLS